MIQVVVFIRMYDHVDHTGKCKTEVAKRIGQAKIVCMKTNNQFACIRQITTPKRTSLHA